MLNSSDNDLYQRTSRWSTELFVRVLRHTRGHLARHVNDWESIEKRYEAN